ncbi:hypothetical protein OT109_18130 [Phycisphaeraceae bacterium D3-23]
MPDPIPTKPEWIDDRTVRVQCPAKVNLALSVGAPHADGMHPIASWMVPIVLSDTLTIRRSFEPGAPDTFKVRFAEDAPVRQPVDWPLESDLAYRAFCAVEERGIRDLPMEVDIEKRIPAGAGLGGGSADAAGMLVGLNMVFGLEMDGSTLMRIASRLGSDVMFQLSTQLIGSGAVVTGTGERIEPLPVQPRTPLLLILPPFGCSTPAVYRAFDEADGPSAPREPDADRVWDLVNQSLTPRSPLFNDLAKPACTVQPDLQQVLDKAHVLGLSPHITGSGSAVFCVLDGKMPSHEADSMARNVAEATGCAVVSTRTAG